MNLVKKYNFVDGLPPNLNSPSSMTQNNQIQHQTPEYRQKYSEQENISWLVDHHRRGRLPASNPILKTYTDENGKLQKYLTREGINILNISDISNDSPKFLNIPKYSDIFRVITKKC